MLWRLAAKNQRWRVYDNFLVGENRWRAQRFGPREGLIDFGDARIKPMDELMTELAELVAPDAGALKSVDEIERVRELALLPTSSERQRTAFQSAREAGADEPEALKRVVDHLIEEFHVGL